MTRINRWIRGALGQKQPTDRLDLPNDWLTIHLWFDERQLSTKQRRALRSLDGWRPLVKIESRKLREDVALEQQIERYVGEFEHEYTMAIQIRREETGEDGTRRNIRAQNSISEILATFPDEQIRITRVADLDVHAESRDAGDVERGECQPTENGQGKAISLFEKGGEDGD